MTPKRILHGRFMCTACSNAAVREWNLQHPARALASARKRVRAYQLRHPGRKPSATAKRSYNREWTLRRKYNLSVIDYDALLREQDGRCAICRSDEAGGKGLFHIDHSHATGHIRGLLCTRCNLGIGALREDPLVLRAAIEYLIHAALRRTA